MLWWQNIPLFSILLCLLSGAVCFLLPPRASRRWALAVLTLLIAGGAVLLGFLSRPENDSFRFMMGHFPAPWGNEIRAGVLEALLAVLFPFVMLCALMGGGRHLTGELAFREPLYMAVCMLLMSALLSQVYSNDIFTSYVFLEIMTLTACALIISRDTGRALAAGMRYMVLNLVGSGLFLLGVVLLYNLTGQLLMENLASSLNSLQLSGDYHRSLTLIIGLITVGLCVKSALFPFHEWVPDAYSSGFSASNAILSSLVSKGYIVLLLKIYCRVFDWDLVAASHVDHILMLFSWSAILFGSLAAIRERSFTRMIAWSSVAQIGYIYLGIALGAGRGYQAALFHLCVHACAKSLLFLSGGALKDAAGSDRLGDLAGAARARPVYGVCWTIAALAMVGMPFTGGMLSKLFLGDAALNHRTWVAAFTLLLLALSTLLNVYYFMRAVLLVWSPPSRDPIPVQGSRAVSRTACVLLALGVMATFFLADPLFRAISLGLSRF